MQFLKIYKENVFYANDYEKAYEWLLHACKIQIYEKNLYFIFSVLVLNIQ